MHITQISAFIENKPGRLAEVIGWLAEDDVNIHALSIADTTDFGILRLIVNDPQKARALLKSRGLTVKLTDVIAVALTHKPGSLAKVLREMDKINASIEYMYAFTSRSSDHDAMVIFRLENQEETTEKLMAAGIEIIDSSKLEYLSK